MLTNLPRSIFPLVSTNQLAHLLKIDKKDKNNLFALAKTVGKYYSPFDTFQEKGNKWRHIDNPIGRLKYIQGQINKKILRPVMLSLPDSMIGGIVGKSVINNALPHIKKETVIRIDLKNCFPKTTNLKVHYVWRVTLGCGANCANILTKLTTFQRRLPQGASTSPALCNLVMLPLFTKIQDYASKHNLSVTMFIDDITFSGTAQTALLALGPIIDLIQKYGYAIRHKKINIMPAYNKQITTGLLVNKKIGIERQKVEEIRRLILHHTKKTSLSKHDYDSIIGKIINIKRYSEHHGEKLEKFAEMLLPKSIIYVQKPKDKTRKCYSTKWHEED